VKTITLTIDGLKVTAAEGSTVLEAARGAGIDIPTVCAHPDLPDYGACRMCIVEIDGVRGYPTSCTTPARENMRVQTKTPELQKQRDRVMELMMSGHPNACLVCDHRVDCEKYRPRSSKAGATTRCGFCSNRDGCGVREIALRAATDRLNLPTLYSHHNLERDDPFMDRDHNLCILCGLCWRICEKIHGAPAISAVRRGRWAKIGPAFGRSYVNSGCTFCGACVDICPTGTLTDRYARWYGHSVDGPISACTLCPEGCTFRTRVNDGRLVSTRMVSNERDARLCALGRFAYPQLVNATHRLQRPMVRSEDELVPADWDEAIPAVAERLCRYVRRRFVLVANEAESRETRAVYERFVKEVMKGRIAWVPAGGGFDDLRPPRLRRDFAEGRVRAALVTGDYLDRETAEKIEYLVLADFLSPAAGEIADAVFPVSVLSEVEGTFRASDGEVRRTVPVSGPPGLARSEWSIIGDLALAMGADESFADGSVGEITAGLNGDGPARPFRGSPRDSLRELPARFRGHPLADTVPALEAMGLPATPKPPRVRPKDGFAIVEKSEVVPNFHRFKIKAPAIARHAKPGQFIILMPNESSERTPFTLVDWSAEEETITLLIEELGRTTRELADLDEGDSVAHVTGPLGLPLPIEKYGTVVLGGGCYGVGAIYPLARAMKEAGNRVIAVIEACSSYLLHMEDELRAVCDDLRLATKDGSAGTKGGVQEIFVELDRAGPKPDLFVAIGCTFMMRMVSEKTKELGVPLQVALNPIMIDGTGMCGACRVSVDGETQFACVDGPFFDGHAVDWDELFARRRAFVRLEVQAMPQEALEDVDSHGALATLKCK
jgi:NAD(P)H-flavin reductase/Fe-S-cluster-containing dehydrogenase component